MNKNIKRMFFVLTLITLLATVGAVCATDDANSTTITDSSVNEHIVAQQITTTSNDINYLSTKNVKKEETTRDLYVSDNRGSDDNSGTNDSPYKTVQKALNQTNSDSTFNIHIAEGTYKGLGNTNLTVNGNYNINFIGDGINKTVFDGEVEYYINSSAAWGQDTYWDYYNFTNGNWAMNISEGTGHISISNMNIQHMLTIAEESSIEFNYLGTVTNYGNLSVDNVLFYQNLGGLGAGIQNKADATLIVNNSIFQENRKSSGTGNFGAGIYNNGTALIENSKFIKNAARWGTITNDHIITINNCTLRDGISYDLGSTYKYGSGIASNTGSADYYNRYRIYGIITNINNCQFENNGQTDVYQAEGNLTLTNSTFNNATGVYLTDNIFNWNYNDEFSFIIENNTFDTVKISSLFTTLSSYSDKVFAIYSNSKYNALIKDNTITLNNDGFGIYLTNNNTVENNTLDSKIQVEGNNNNITQNTITNNEKATIYLGNSANNNIITDNTLKSLVTTGNNAISTNNQQNTIENNLPESPADIELNDETYPNFFNEDGTIKQDIANGTIIKIIGDVNNKNIIIDNVKVGLKRENGKLNNVSITVKETANILIDSVTINNTNNNPYVIKLESENNMVTNSIININTTSPITAIIINKDHNQLDSNTLNIYGPSSNTKGLADTIAVDIESSSNKLTSNTYNIYNNTNNEEAYIIGIKINNENKISNNFINDSKTFIQNNNVIGRYIENSDNNTMDSGISYQLSATNRAIGIYLIDSNNNNIFENIYTNHMKHSTGIKIEGKTKTANNNTIKSNQITTNGETANCIELINTNNTIITSTDINSTYKPNGNNISLITVQNSNNTDISYLTTTFLTTQFWTAKDNTSSMFKVYNSDNTIINGISFEPRGNGSYIQIENSTNTYIGKGTSQNDVIIKTTDVPILIKNSTKTNITGITAIIDNSIAIELTDSENNSITNNYLQAQYNGGNIAINKINSNNNELINNTPETLIITEENYDEHFTEGIFNKENTLIIIDSNFTNKTLTFKNPNTQLYNPNNYTIIDGKLEFTPEATGTNITNLNTKDTSIIIESDNSLLENSTITSDTDKLELIINNAKGVIINNNTFIAENQEEKPAINVINSQATITNNYILTKDSVGNQAIKNTNSQITTTNNIPIPKLTDDNYNQFFNENGIYNSSELINILELGSDIYNKNMTFNTEITLNNPENYTIYNTTITNTEKLLTLSNININNSNYINPTIISSNITLNNNTIYQSGENINVIILENGLDNSEFKYNNIRCDGNNNVLIKCNNISIYFAYNNIECNGTNTTTIKYNNTPVIKDSWGWENPTTTNMNYNNITLTGDKNIFLNTTDANIRFEYNNLNVTTETGETPTIYYTNKSSINYIRYNNITINTTQPITAVLIDTARVRFNQNKVLVNTNQNNIPIIKVITTTNGQANNNYIESLDLVGNDAIETPGTKTGNTPTTTGFKSQITDIIVPEQIITNIETNIIINVTDSFGREITGIYIIDDGEITTTSETNTINYIPQTTGEKTLTITYTDPTGKYNTTSTIVNIEVTTPTLTVDPITSTAGQTINITARITAGDETITNINKGKVTFKVNGKTLKDANGKVIYAKVVNGTATIENYEVPSDWAKEGTTIQAVYSGSAQCDKLTSEKTNITVAKAVPTLTTEDVTTTAGGKITLKATITDNDKVINAGKIVFKINGKTVKDENGKVIYAKVVNNTVEFEYTLPESYKAGSYNITATFISADYDRLTDSKTLTVTN